MAETAKVTFQKFHKLYSTEDACRAELFRYHFLNDFVCPVCGYTEYFSVSLLPPPGFVAAFACLFLYSICKSMSGFEQSIHIQRTKEESPLFS